MVQSRTVQAATKRRLKILLFLIIAFAGWAIYTLFNQLNQKDSLNEKLMTLQGERDQLQQEIEGLQNEVMLLNDPEYMSQLATKEQGMLKEGEQQIFSE